MAEVYTSLFKGKVHITTPFSSRHPALDMGNYKTKNKTYSPNKFGTGKITRQTASYTYGGKRYTNVLTQWITYNSGFESCTVHGDYSNKILKVGDSVKVGQLVYITGNKGYSFGDHLHYQLKKNGKLVDPTPYVMNDAMKYKKGDKLYFNHDMNFRNSKGVVSGTIKKGAVGENISDKLGSLPASAGDWDYYNVKFLNTIVYAADTNFNEKTTKAITQTDGKIPIIIPPEPPKPTNPPVDPELKRLESLVIVLNKQNKEKETALVTLKGDLKACKDENTLMKREIVGYIDGAKDCVEKFKKANLDRIEAVKKLNDYKKNIVKIFIKGTKKWIVSVLEKILRKN